ncbi:MFS general substrate transporter [Mollisia scopiformis]|uniref:MFS general substrate transporter n=1 Tax=Mollisia scopiformis TaxID=149040 RepID=A0A194XRU2_MOLSC|nr:MFS general substrate transporter [Mollisia scopiformis]KUJ22913.1 MFS general substrate transporter [Mollisia scopiformis]
MSMDESKSGREERTTEDATKSFSERDPEKYEESNGFNSSENLRLDNNGLPLVPQPSRFKDDPLNWPSWLKWAVLIQVGFMAFLGPYNSALINPSLVLLSNAINVSSKTAAYTTTTSIILGGISPFIWTPLTNYHGRRPITLVAILLTILGGIGSGVSSSFSELMGTRVVAGFGFGGMMSVGTACVNDMFFLHERGEKTGVYSLFVTNGAHVAALVGGFLGQSAGWQWDYYLGALSTALSFIIAFFLFPETLFSRDPNFLSNRHHERTYTQMLFDFKGNMIPGRHLHVSDFLQSFRMLKYPSVLFPFWYYTWSWTFINVMPAVSLATIYTQFYHLSAGPIGACLGISLIIGSVLGELSAGKLSDIVMLFFARRNSNIRKPEFRLYLCTLSAIFMPLGLIIFGATVGKYNQYVPLVGLGVGVFGLQIASTTLYAYVSDCYKPQTPESGVLFNLSRGLSFVVGYFALPFADRVGYFWAWFTFAAVLFSFFWPILALMRWGERWRIRLGEPRFHRYL